MFVVFLLEAYGFPLMNWIGGHPIFKLVKYPLHMTREVALSGGDAVRLWIEAPRRDGRAFPAFLCPGVAIVLVSLAAFWIEPPQNTFSCILAVPAIFFMIVSTLVLLAARSLIRPRAFTAVVAAVCASLPIPLYFRRNRAISEPE
jgi:hypothetical protein